MVIINTKIILYTKRSSGAELRIHEVLKFTYNEMLNDEYDSKIALRTERFEAIWGKCMASLRLNFTKFKVGQN